MHFDLLCFVIGSCISLLIFWPQRLEWSDIPSKFNVHPFCYGYLYFVHQFKNISGRLLLKESGGRDPFDLMDSSVTALYVAAVNPPGAVTDNGTAGEIVPQYLKR